jgi:predicted protein tyrosine phosphatase
MPAKNAPRRRIKLRPLDLALTVHDGGPTSPTTSPGSPPSPACPWPGTWSSDSEHDRPCQISAKTFLGSQFDAMNKTTLKEYGITKVLTIQLEDLPQKYKRHFHEQNHKFIEMKDCASANIMEKFDEAIEFLSRCEKTPGNTLVHCRMGISRSATICTAFLMKTQQLNFDDAFGRVRERRPQAGPNFGFLGQLKVYESQITVQ